MTFGICYNYTYKHKVWHEYKLTNVGASIPFQVPVPPYFPDDGNSFLVHDHIILFHALHMSSPWSTMTHLSFILLLPIHFINSGSSLDTHNKCHLPQEAFPHFPTLPPWILVSIHLLQLSKRIGLQI